MWRESLEHVSMWDLIRLRRMADRALSQIGTIDAEGSRCEEIALFNAAFGQWHLVLAPAHLLPVSRD